MKATPILGFAMELNRDVWYAMIFYDFLKILKQRTVYQSLSSAFSDVESSRAIISNWHKEFKRGKRSLEDDMKSRRPSTFHNRIESREERSTNHA